MGLTEFLENWSLSYLVGESWGKVYYCASECVGCRDIGECVAEAVVLPWLAVQRV